MVAESDVDGFVQNCSISSALALEIVQYCTKPLIWGAHGLINGRIGVECYARMPECRQWHHAAWVIQASGGFTSSKHAHNLWFHILKPIFKVLILLKYMDSLLDHTKNENWFNGLHKIHPFFHKSKIQKSEKNQSLAIFAFSLILLVLKPEYFGQTLWHQYHECWMSWLFAIPGHQPP